MRITESRLRRIIRNVIRESIEYETVEAEASAIIEKYPDITEDNIDDKLVMHNYISNEVEGNFEAENEVRNRVIEKLGDEQVSGDFEHQTMDSNHSDYGRVADEIVRLESVIFEQLLVTGEYKNMTDFNDVVETFCKRECLDNGLSEHCDYICERVMNQIQKQIEYLSM